MTEPWFNPNAWAWLPGTTFGVLGGILGSAAGILAPRGKAKGLILGAWHVMLLASAALMIIAVVALASGQPYGIWFFLGLPGFQGLLVLGLLLPVVKRVYHQSETRKMEARDLLS